MSNDFQFLDAPRADPEKISAPIRIQNWNEIYGSFDPENASTQSDRCLAKRLKYRIEQIHCPKYVDAFARKTDCAKALAP